MSLFISLSADGCLSCFHFAVNINELCYCEYLCPSLCVDMFFFLILLGTYLGMELFSYTVTLCLTL